MITVRDIPYSDLEAAALVEKLKNEETFEEAIGIFFAWVQRGEFEEKNQEYFNLMFQSISTHGCHLLNTFGDLQRQLQEIQEKQQEKEAIDLQIQAAGEVLNAACMPEVLSNFTDAERDNILLWRKNAEEVKENDLNICVEMDNVHLSEGNDSIAVAAAKKFLQVHETIAKSNSLRSVASASANELACQQEVKAEPNASKAQQEALPQQNLKEVKVIETTKDSERGDVDSSADASGSSNNTITVTVQEMFVVVVMSGMLAEENGATVDEICLRLQSVFPTISSTQVEALLRKHTNRFHENSTGSGADLQKKWIFQPS